MHHLIASAKNPEILEVNPTLRSIGYQPYLFDWCQFLKLKLHALKSFSTNVSDSSFMKSNQKFCFQTQKLKAEGKNVYHLKYLMDGSAQRGNLHFGNNNNICQGTNTKKAKQKKFYTSKILGLVLRQVLNRSGILINLQTPRKEILSDKVSLF